MKEKPPGCEPCAASKFTPSTPACGSSGRRTRPCRRAAPQCAEAAHRRNAGGETTCTDKREGEEREGKVQVDGESPKPRTKIKTLWVSLHITSRKTGGKRIDGDNRKLVSRAREPIFGVVHADYTKWTHYILEYKLVFIAETRSLISPVAENEPPCSDTHSRHHHNIGEHVTRATLPIRRRDMLILYRSIVIFVL